MRILGLSEGAEPSAALIEDDRVVAWVAGERLPVRPSDDGLPAAAHVVLSLAGVGPEAVDVVAVAGRYRAARTRPMASWVRRLVDDPMSPLREGEAALQGLLRRTGLGAYRSDVEEASREASLREVGFTRARLRLVDAHRALAEAAYRSQGADDVRILVVEPYGDGELASLHAGRAGQLDVVWHQVGPEPLHALLARLGPVLQLPAWDPSALGSWGASGSPRREVVETLSTWLAADRGALVGRVTVPIVDPLPMLLRDVSPADAAASVREVVVAALVGLVRHHLADQRPGRLALAGSIVADARVAGAIAAALPGWTLAAPAGSVDAAAALGAAMAHSQPPPRDLDPHLGPGTVDDAERIADRMGARATLGPGPLNAILDGEGVLRWASRAPGGPVALGARAVLTRADDPAVARRVRRLLRMPSTTEPRVLVAPSADPAPGAGPITASGGVAVTPSAGWAARCAGAVLADGRCLPVVVDAGDAPLRALLDAVGRVTGTPALVAWPVAEAGEAPVRTPEEAVAVYRRAGLGALWTEKATWSRP